MEIKNKELFERIKSEIATLQVVHQHPTQKIAEYMYGMIQDYEEVDADKDRLVREIDIILCSKDGAAKQASLCDLVSPIQKLKEQNTNMKDVIRINDEFVKQTYDYFGGKFNHESKQIAEKLIIANNIILNKS